MMKGYPRKFHELLAGTPLHLTLNQVSYHSAESMDSMEYLVKCVPAFFDVVNFNIGLATTNESWLPNAIV